MKIVKPSDAEINALHSSVEAIRGDPTFDGLDKVAALAVQAGVLWMLSGGVNPLSQVIARLKTQADE